MAALRRLQAHRPCHGKGGTQEVMTYTTTIKEYHDKLKYGDTDDFQHAEAHSSVAPSCHAT